MQIHRLPGEEPAPGGPDADILWAGGFVVRGRPGVLQLGLSGRRPFTQAQTFWMNREKPVGRGFQSLSEVTSGLSEWSQCPGLVGSGSLPEGFLSASHWYTQSRDRLPWDCDSKQLTDKRIRTPTLWLDLFAICINLTARGWMLFLKIHNFCQWQ